MPLVLAPFRALRYDSARVSDLAAVISPPYDVIDDAGVDRLLAAHPSNVVRLILPRGPEDGPDSRYARAAATLADWRSDGTLQPDPEAALYVYEEVDGGHVQRGLVGALGLEPFDAGIVLPHENVMPGPVADRLALMTATDANLEPIFLVYHGGGPASEIVAETAKGEPLVSAVTDDGVTHRLWAITDPDALAAIATDLAPRRAVIADGHHRYTTYLHMQQEHRDAGHGAGPWDYGLTLLVDTSEAGPQVHAIHRVLRGITAAEVARRAKGECTVHRLGGAESGVEAAIETGLGELGRDEEQSGPAFVIADEQDVFLLTWLDPVLVERTIPLDHSPAWKSLDVTVAHYTLIQALCGLADTVETVGYAHDVAEARSLAAAAGGCALLLNPTPVEAVIAVAEAGDRMPRKSTLFTPKPRTGLLIRAFADG